jgi:hypothetical protein
VGYIFSGSYTAHYAARCIPGGDCNIARLYHKRQYAKSNANSESETGVCIKQKEQGTLQSATLINSNPQTQITTNKNINTKPEPNPPSTTLPPACCLSHLQCAICNDSDANMKDEI